MSHSAAVEEAESRRYLPAARNLVQPVATRSPGSFRRVGRSPKHTDRLRIVGHHQRHTRFLSQKPLHTIAARNPNAMAMFSRSRPVPAAQRSFISNRARQIPRSPWSAKIPYFGIRIHAKLTEQ